MGDAGPVPREDLTALTDEELRARMVANGLETEALFGELQRRCPGLPLLEMYGDLAPVVGQELHKKFQKPQEPPKAH